MNLSKREQVGLAVRLQDCRRQEEVHREESAALNTLRMSVLKV